MLAKLRRRLTYANIVSSICLFLAVGGGAAYAANTVFSTDIVDGEVKTADLALQAVNRDRLGNSAVVRQKINNDAVDSSKVAADSLGGADVLESSLGEVPSAAQASSVAAGGVGTAALASGSVTADKLAQGYAASVLGTSFVSVPAAQNFAFQANHEIFDTANLHDTTSGTEYLVAPVTGTYVVSAIVDWDPSSAGYRRTSIVGPNGALASAAGPALPAPAYTSQSVTGIERLSAGQAVYVQALQGSGGPLNGRLNRFQMAFVGK